MSADQLQFENISEAVEFINKLSEQCGELAMKLEADPNFVGEAREFLEKASTHAAVSVQLISRMGRAIAAVEDPESIEKMQEAIRGESEIVPWWQGNNNTFN